MGRFSQAASDARSTTPRGVSRREGWWIVIVAVVLGVSHGVVYQSHAFEWGGVVRAAVLFLMILGVAWVSWQRSAAERKHPAGHGRLLAAASAWGVLVVLVAGWFWIVPADGHPVGWGVTGLVAVIGLPPLVLVGLRLVRAGDRRV